jgi:hypothetical protein
LRNNYQNLEIKLKKLFTLAPSRGIDVENVASTAYVPLPCRRTAVYSSADASKIPQKNYLVYEKIQFNLLTQPIFYGYMQ